MKAKILYIYLILSMSVLAVQAQGINGRVLDAQNGESLPGATVAIPELKISTSTNSNGAFSLKNTPEKGRFVVEVRFMGYQTLTQSIDLSAGKEYVFKLSASTIEAREVVITGSASGVEKKRNSSAISLMGREQLLKQSNNVVEAISRIPGVSQISTGGGISKPVIRGLGYNRVITLADGAKQEGQQWGDEHGIEIDQFNVEKVEVLKGAASLLYGSDALGGVINMLDPLPAELGKIKGEFLSNYSTNNGLLGTSAMLHGNTNGLVWRLRSSFKDAIAYATPVNRIPNTGFKEYNFSGQLGLNKKWGYAHLNFSSFNSKVGLPDFVPNNNGDFEDEDGNVLSDAQIRSRSLMLPYQQIGHRKIALNSNLLLGRNRLRSNITFQNNLRREFEESTAAPSLFFDLKTLSYDFKYYLEERNNWERVFGLSGSFQNSQNKGEEFLIPDYASQEVGAFAYFRKNWENSSLNFGSRIDFKKFSGEELLEGNDLKFEAFENSFANWSGAIGFTHQLNDKLNLKANIGSAFRAPNIAELSSNGVHEGTFRYEIGNADLKPERSFYADMDLEYSTEKISAEWSLFYNQINNYIYYRQNNNETIAYEGETYPLFRFVQDRALLKGTEISLTLHPIELIHFENSFALTIGENLGSKNPLPFMPAGVFRNELRIEPEIRGLQRSYVSFGLDHFLKQSRTDVFEQATPGYSLLNASLGTTLKWGKQSIRVHVAANNLLNKAYYDHLSRFKPGRLDESDPGLGFFNPGRNFTFGLMLPLNF